MGNIEYSKEQKKAIRTLAYLGIFILLLLIGFVTSLVTSEGKIEKAANKIFGDNTRVNASEDDMYLFIDIYETENSLLDVYKRQG